MGSCENSIAVEVLHESLHKTAVAQHQQQNVCSLKNSDSGQEQRLPCLENGSDISNGNVGPASASDGCIRLSQNDSAGCVSSANFVADVSVVDQGFGLVCGNSNAISLVREKLSEDECRTTGDDKLNEMQSGSNDDSKERDELCVEKIGSSDENHVSEKLLEDCEQSLLKCASVENGIGTGIENGYVVCLAPGNLLEDDCEITYGNLNGRKSGIEDCNEQTDESCVENKGSSNNNHVLPNVPQHCDQSMELMAASGLHGNHDEQDHQKDDRSGPVQGAIEEKTNVLSATETDICEQMGTSLHCEVSAELIPTNASPRNEVEQDEWQSNNDSLERVLVVMENKNADAAGSETDCHDHNCSSLDHESRPQLRYTKNSMGGCLQQDAETINGPAAAKEGLNDILPVMEATNCNQLVSHQGFCKSLELTPLMGSPKDNGQPDKEKFDWSVHLYTGKGLEQNENNILVMEKPVVDNEILSALVDKSCMASDSCSGFPRDCCQQNDRKTEPDNVSFSMAVHGTSGALTTLPSDAGAKELPQGTEMPIELSSTSFLVGSCDRNNYQNNDKDVNCVSAESVPTDINEESYLDGCIKACPSQASCRTLENLTMADPLSNCDQKNEQSDDKSVDGPSLKSKPVVVEEGSDVTTEIKSEKETVFRAICAADCSEHTTSGAKDLAMNDSPVKSIGLDIGLSSSRRSNRTRKSSQKTKRASKKCKNKCKVQDMQIFKAERRKRSCLSKPARSSNWGLLGNITQFFEWSNGLGLYEIQNDEPIQTKVGRSSGKQNKRHPAGSSRKSTTEKQISSGVIRLKVKVGNEVVQNSLNNMIPEVIDASASVGDVVSDFETKLYQGANLGVPNFANCMNVKMGKVGTQEQSGCFGNKLEEARIHSDASLLEFHVASKDSEGILFSQKSSGDAEVDHLGVSSHVEDDALGAVTEKRYTDPGTSPDSEVINLVPESQGNTRCQDFPDAVLDISKAFVAPGVIPISKKGKKKGRVTHARDFIPDDKPTGVGNLNKVKANKNRRGKQKKGDKVFSAKIFASSSANASSNSSSSKEYSEEQLPQSRETELRVSGDASLEQFGAETKISSSLDVGLRLSEPQNSNDLLPSTKVNGCQLPRKSGGASKGGSNVSDKARSQREATSRQRKKERKSVKKNKVKQKAECNDFIQEERPDPEIGNCFADDAENPKSHDNTASLAVANLYTASSVALEQHSPVDNAWVRCDKCYKWRRIPVALVDSIGQTNCQWICKDNMEKAFADCSIPQEKSNAEINAELGLSDAEEDAFDAPSKNKGVEYKRTAVSKEHEFTRISSNQFLHRSRKTQTIDEIMVCHCKLPLSGSGCGDECLNRMLNIECVRGTCPCGDFCSNQQFQKRNYAKMKWDRCGKKGFGLRLEEDVSKGQFLIEYVGEVLDMHTYEARQREYAYKGHKHFYFMTLNGSEVIDACAKGNLGRFINHSCDPNCRTEKWVVNGEICIGLFALRDIKKSEEVTFDYNYVRVFGAAAKKCYCGSPQCRGYIGGDPTNTEVIDQVDSDEEFLEPVMLEVGEAGDRSKTRISRASNLNDVEPRVAESILHGVDKKDNSLTVAGKTVATEMEDSVNPSTSSVAILEGSLELDDIKGRSPSASQQADDTKSEPLPAVKQEISSEQIQRLDTSSAAMLNKSLSDSMVVNKRLKSEEKRVFVKSRFLIKASHQSGCTKKVKSTSNPLTVSNKVHAMTANKSQVMSMKLKKLMDGTTNGRFETVEGKLNELLDTDGGISKRKDAAKGYLKFLLLTAASGASGNGEAIQSNRDLSMILDALLKTKSKVVLIDIINKNGLRMLHNMLKQYRSDFKKIPILRKLLKVLEYLVARDILTPEHIYGGPPCPGMESFRESMLSLTEHNDKPVHQFARSFRDRWFPRHGRKYSYMDRDDVRNEFHRGSISTRVSPPQNHMCDLTGKSTEDIDGAMQQKVTIASVDYAVSEGSSSPSARDGTRTRKRKSRWDQPAEEKPSPRSHQHDEQRIQSGLPQQFGYNLNHLDVGNRDNSYCPHCFRNYCQQVEANCTALGRENIQTDVPPGFASPPLNPALVSTNASSTISDLSQLNGCLMVPEDVVVGQPQGKFISRLSVSYGIPLLVMQQLQLPQDGSVESWAIAPGIPFHPFPPLPPFPHRKSEASSAVNSMAIDETTEEGKQCRQDPATSCSNEKISSTTAGNQPDMNFPGDNGQQSFKRVRAASQDLGRRYFRQQKWNKRPPRIRHMNGWGHFGSNLKGCIYSSEVGNAAHEPRNSYSSQAGDCINQQKSTL